jgi:hypothetical protein
MSDNPQQLTDTETSPPSDVCLLLRSHAESRWLSQQVVPVLREIEQRDELPDEQLGAALAYLEVLWIEACARAAETDAMRTELDARGPGDDHTLHDKARRYHAAARRLRDVIARRVARLLAVPAESSRHGLRAPGRIIPRPTEDRRASS